MLALTPALSRGAMPASPSQPGEALGLFLVVVLGARPSTRSRLCSCGDVMSVHNEPAPGEAVRAQPAAAASSITPWLFAS